MFSNRAKELIILLFFFSFFSLPPLIFKAFAEDNPSLAAFRYKEDLNGDGKITIFDLVEMLGLMKKSPGDQKGDCNGDGKFDIFDVISFLRGLARGEYNPTNLSSSSWRVLGPGGGGAQYLPTVNPFDPGNVFVRCDMTGGYVTYNNSQSWRMLNLRSGIEDYEFDPSSRGTVYAASTGLYRSEDGGYAWYLIYPNPADIVKELMVGDHAEQWFETALGQPEGEIERSIVKVRVDPANSYHLWLARSNSYGGTPYRLLVSNDRGATWQTVVDYFTGRVLDIFPGAWWDKPEEVIVITQNEAVRVEGTSGPIADLELPETPLIAAAGGKGGCGIIFYVLTDSTVYRSADLGSTWQSRNTSLISGARFNTLAVCENHPDAVYLACGSYSTDQYGIFRSTDGGANWSWIYQVQGNSIVSNNYTAGWMDRSYGPTWRGDAFSLGIAPSDPNTCYATDWGSTMRTTDGGAHWEQAYTNLQADNSAISRGLDVTTCYGVHFDPFNSEHIFVSYTDIGAFQSFDGGQSWVHAINGVPGGWRNTCYWAVFDPAVPGRAWSAWGSAHDLPREKMFRSGFSGKVGGVAVTDDSCKTWRVSGSGLPASMVCTHIVLDTSSSSSARTLYVCGFRQGIYKSTDGGKTWSPTSAVPGTNKNYWRLCLLPNGRLFVLVVRDRVGGDRFDGGLYRSDNGGASWQQVALPERVIFPNDLIYDPANPQRMYLSCWPWTEVGGEYKGGWLVTERGGGLLLTEDGGATWRRVFQEDAHVYAAALDPANPSIVYINTFDSAAFRSVDRGETWTRIKGYNFKWGHRPVADPYHPGMLYLTTFGGGLHYGPGAGAPSAIDDIVNVPDQWRWGN